MTDLKKLEQDLVAAGFKAGSEPYRQAIEIAKGRIAFAKRVAEHAPRESPSSQR